MNLIILLISILILCWYLFFVFQIADDEQTNVNIAYGSSSVSVIALNNSLVAPSESHIFRGEDATQGESKLKGESGLFFDPCVNTMGRAAILTVTYGGELLYLQI